MQPRTDDRGYAQMSVSMPWALCCVPVRRDPPPWALGPGKQRSVIVHRRHLKLGVTFFLGFQNVSVSVAYYFLFKRDYLVDNSWIQIHEHGRLLGILLAMWLIVWASAVARKRALLLASHCGLFSSRLCGCCLTAPLTTAAAVVGEPVCQRVRRACESARLAPSPCWTALCFLWST